MADTKLLEIMARLCDEIETISGKQPNYEFLGYATYIRELISREVNTVNELTFDEVKVMEFYDLLVREQDALAELRDKHAEEDIGDMNANYRQWDSKLAEARVLTTKFKEHFHWLFNK
jgi:hypothetical protein